MVRGSVLYYKHDERTINNNIFEVSHSDISEVLINESVYGFTSLVSPREDVRPLRVKVLSLKS